MSTATKPKPAATKSTATASAHKIRAMPSTAEDWLYCERLIRQFAVRIAETRRAVKGSIPKMFDAAAAAIPEAFGFAVSLRPRRTTAGRPETPERWETVAKAIVIYEREALALSDWQRSILIQVVSEGAHLLRVFRSHVWDTWQETLAFLDQVAPEAASRNAAARPGTAKPVASGRRKPAQTTAAYVPDSRLGTSLLGVHVPTQDAENFKALARLQNMSAAALLGGFVREYLAAHEAPQTIQAALRTQMRGLQHDAPTTIARIVKSLRVKR